MVSKTEDSSIATGKCREAVCLARIMCGIRQNDHIDQRWMEVTLKEQGPDGLIYIPVGGRPWIFGNTPDYVSGGIDRNLNQMISPFHNGQTFRNMALYATRDGGNSRK